MGLLDASDDLPGLYAHVDIQLEQIVGPVYRLHRFDVTDAEAKTLELLDAEEVLIYRL